LVYVNSFIEEEGLRPWQLARGRKRRDLGRAGRPLDVMRPEAA
jgi:hypothetical protein